MKMSSEQSRECFVLGEYYYAFWGKLSGEIFPLHSFILIFAFFFENFHWIFEKLSGTFWCGVSGQICFRDVAEKMNQNGWKSNYFMGIRTRLAIFLSFQIERPLSLGAWKI